MKNHEIADTLQKIAILLDMENVQFKPRAYEKAALIIADLDEGVEQIYNKEGIEGLMQIPGVGKSIAEKIEEVIQTGKLKYYEELRSKVPVDLDSLSGIEGLGPKTIKKLWEELRIANIDDLERACLSHQVRKISGLGEKTEQKILEGIKFSRRSKDRYLLGYVLPQIREIETRLKSLTEVQAVAISGSIRRMKETVGDADFIVLSEKPKNVMDFFISMPGVAEVISKGDTRSSVRLDTGMHSDVRVIPEESFGAALQYFTGSKEHNVALRRIAQNRGWKLSEYGLFHGKTNKRIAGTTQEEGIYQKLGLQWIPPELRENTNEIDVAAKRGLPKLIGYSELKGDLQVHSTWTDGSNSIREMAEEAASRGLEYVVISDHSKSPGMTGGLDEGAIRAQAKEVEELNERSGNVSILKGVEMNILKDGSLDLPHRLLQELDVVGAAIHSHFNLERKEMTERVLKAIENPDLDILYHPTARQIQKREPVQIDIDKIVQAARDSGVILDIDSSPERLDLKDEYIRRAVDIGAKLGISSDSHAKSNFRHLELGIAQARRGWATAKDIVNTQSIESFLKLLKRSPITRRAPAVSKSERRGMRMATRREKKKVMGLVAR